MAAQKRRKEEAECLGLSPAANYPAAEGSEEEEEERWEPQKPLSRNEVHRCGGSVLELQLCGPQGFGFPRQTPTP